MSSNIASGRPGNLTSEEEEKLRKLWALVLQICAVNPEDRGLESVDGPGTEAAKDTEEDKADLAAAGDKTKKKRLGLFSRKSKKDTDADSILSKRPASGAIAPIKEGDDDKYGQTKHFFDTLANQSPESIRATIWSMVKHDHPDALLLRFLRARKWDVDKALVMLVSTMNWRAHDMHVDDDIMKHGEAAALEGERGPDVQGKKLGHDFMAQIRMGKSFLHGIDKNGRPICVVRVRLHKQGEQCEESLERYTVYIIETARMVLQQPVDTATIIFDMTGFSMANMDYTPVKFMIKCFEANYPESLGAVLVHKAPWIFQGIWKIIRGWLDPVVANKVHFTNNAKEMGEFIEPSRILKELEGEEEWEYNYAEPIPGENDKMKDTATRDQLLREREQIYKGFEEATFRWFQETEGEAGQAHKRRRNEIARKMHDDYWIVDPYIRARSLYDRIGMLQPGGKVDYYPASTTTGPPRTEINDAATATTATITTVDDVD